MLFHVFVMNQNLEQNEESFRFQVGELLGSHQRELKKLASLLKPGHIVSVNCDFMITGYLTISDDEIIRFGQLLSSKYKTIVHLFVIDEKECISMTYKAGRLLLERTN